MAEFKVGAPKARAILEAITKDDEVEPVRPLHAVPEPTIETESEQDDTMPDPNSVTLGEPSLSEPKAQVAEAADPGTKTKARPVKLWPVLLLAMPAFVAVWSGWVGLGRLTGFGPIQLLPGIWDDLTINSAITLPIGVEAYSAFALRVWLSSSPHTGRARRFAKWSALGSLALGMVGQVAYHLMSAASVTHAPWPVTTLVSCLPVVVLGSGAALAHLVRDTTDLEVRN
ncbi:ABC transporter permease [Amycolatopsis sp. lyj-90]|uniref:ABC transporter permease n=1 Tax=Amycolatopsis sp. lyj-90 TaxID=2789285 RepID=UPI00397C7B8E